STIANGGEYLKPQILLPGQLDGQPGQPPQLHAEPFRANEDLPNPLPDGSHRVISTMAAAQMRQMMEGIVLYGTGKNAQLNGYSSAGKTGTAQKIDPRTHRYSPSLHIGSFTGFAPVNNPAIAVAVIIDSPKGLYYGSEIAAPVFEEVAQEALEYLGVPHDIPIRAPNKATKPEPAIAEDTSVEDSGADLDALYDAANHLPSDDPQSTEAAGAAQAVATSDAAPIASAPASHPLVQPASINAPAQSPAKPPSTASNSNSVTVSSVKNIAVPSLAGLSVRQVIEKAAETGLQVEIVGDGTVRNQAPAQGTMVQPGTHVVVRCTR